MDAAIRERAIRALHSALHADSADMRRRWFDEFMIEVHAIGRAWPAQLGGDERSFLDETAPLLADPRSPLWMWLAEASGRIRPMEDDDDQLAGALDDRSALQFLLDLYRETAAADVVAGVETDDLDAEIREVCRHFRVPPPPDGIPRTHWWWYGGHTAPA